MTQRRLEREDQLYETASRLFREKGFHNTSMRDLGEALGVNGSALYYYVKSKDELLFRILERGGRLLGAQVDELHAADLSPRDKLHRAFENHALTVMENQDLLSVYLQEYRKLPMEKRQQMWAVRKRFERGLMRILEDGIESGDFRPVNAKVAIAGLLSMLDSTHQWFYRHGELSAQEVAAIVADLAVRAVEAPSGSGANGSQG